VTAGTVWGPTTLPVQRTPRRDQPRRAFVAQLMGLPISIHLRGPRANSPQTAALAEQAFAALAADDATFSTYRKDSTISAIRRGDLPLHLAGARVQEVARLCQEAKHRTHGAFDAWLPGPHGSPAFDPTGLVKGWAVEQAFTQLRDRLPDHDLLINAGGDIAVHCGRTDTPDWRVAIEDPRDRTRTLQVIELRTGAVATSGTAARGAHIINPATGVAAAGPLSATVIGPSLLWADVYATAVFVHGAAAATWLRAQPDYRAITVSRPA
jgi:thiamine biosynthesis lipoprotein